ncbi:MAG: hypothetical protein AAFR27_09520, partial [Pseudomonadota bacterium]
MFVLVLQSALLLAIAFILGCIIGCLLKTLFASDSAGAGAGVATATAATAATATVTAAPKEKVIEPAKPAEPVALVGDKPKPAKKAAPKKSTAK